MKKEEIKNEYRLIIRELLKENESRINISRVLRDVGINRGNFYAFIGKDDTKMGDNSKLSAERLEELVKELKKYDIRFTNRDRLATMSSKKLEKEIFEKFIDNPLGKYIDLTAWLKSSNPALIYQGEDGTYLTENHVWVPCKIVERKTIFGNEYVELIDLETEQLRSVPRGGVRICD